MSVVSQQHLFSSSAMMSDGEGGGGGGDNGGSVDFNNSSLRLASTADLCPGTSDFTFECWLRPVAWGGQWETVYHNGVVNGLFIGKDDSGNFVVRASNNTSFITQSTLPSVNQWTHIAVTRQGSTLRLFYDGVLKNSVSNSYNFPTASTAIGETISGGEGIYGRISNLRFIKGTAVYTSNFTVPTSLLTAIPNTKLLCCQSITSPTVATVDISGLGLYNISGTAGSYAPTGFTGGIDFPSGQGTAENSNGSYILNADTSFSGNYTIEFWFNIDSFGNFHYGTYGCVLLDGRPSSGNGANIFGSIYAANSSGGTNPFALRYHSNGSDWITGSTSLNMGTWHHCALVRNSGTITLYVNGTSEGTYSHSMTMTSNTNRPYVGGWGYIPGVDDFALNGKISNLRIGSTAVYTSSFTPPTSNLTAISGTTFLGLQSTSSARAFTSPSGVLTAIGSVAASSSNPF